MILIECLHCHGEIEFKLIELGNKLIIKIDACTCKCVDCDKQQIVDQYHEDCIEADQKIIDLENKLKQIKGIINED